MCIDLTVETPIPLADVPKLGWIPRRRGGRRLHVSTVHRWCGAGLRGVRLECVQLGGTRVTTEAALQRFLRSCPGAVWRAPTRGLTTSHASGARLSSVTWTPWACDRNHQKGDEKWKL